MNWTFLIGLSVLAGVSIAVQQALNANLKAEINSALWSGFMSYLTGFLCTTVFLVIMREPWPAVATIVRVPLWAWFGGIFGAIYIALSIYLIPQIGVATFMALLIFGQMVASVTFDHFGVLGIAQRSFDLWRAAGVCLLVGGVVLIQRQ